MPKSSEGAKTMKTYIIRRLIAVACLAFCVVVALATCSTVNN